MQIIHSDLASFGDDHDDCVKVVLVHELDETAHAVTRRLYTFARQQINPYHPEEPVIAFTLEFNACGLILVTNFKKAEDVAHLIMSAIATNVPNSRKVSILCPDAMDPDSLAGAMVHELYMFQRYHTKKDPEITKLYVHSQQSSRVGRFHVTVAEEANFARDLVMMPANKLGPLDFAALTEARRLPHITVTVLPQAQLERLGMGSMLCVATGSTRPPCLVIADYHPPTGQRPVVLCGKGVTFDTGGISLKPPRNMHKMKADMGGAAAVVATVMAAARVGLKHRVVALAGMIENFPGRGAVIPGDVVTSMSGRTIEVLDTDAEGRLVLADVLHYAQTAYPDARCIVDVATLTGAIVAGLGPNYAGLFTRNDALATQLLTASSRTRDLLWRMPLEDGVQLRSSVADLRNIHPGDTSDCVYAALFLEAFAPKAIPWAHIDMAGPVFLSSNNSDYPVASGYGVRLLMAFLTAFE
jgi:leucyl aminopeptidase